MAGSLPVTARRQPPDRGCRRVLVARVFGAVLSAVLAVSGCTASIEQAREKTPTTRSLTVLQANLCNSGEARCYTGRSVAQLAGVIRTEGPEVVTLDEICEDDVATLGQALDAVAPDDVVVSAFRAARDRPTDADYTCIRNGRRYGIGVLVRVPAAAAEHTTRGGVYPVQDLADPEERVWVCLDVPDRLVACATHLANTVPSVALAQCRQLMATVFPEGRAAAPAPPTIVAGDFNLLVGGTPDVRTCLPAGLSRADDAAAQHLVTNATITDGRTIDLAGSTDHPALFAVLAVGGVPTPT